MKNNGASDKKGISLIMLVITIIIIIILAVAVILSIANNNPIENAKEARFKNDVKTMQEELELLKASNYASNNGASYKNKDGSDITIGQLQSANNYKDDFVVKDDVLYIKIGNKLTENQVVYASDLGVDLILKLGKEITYKDEPFYVIGGDTVGTEISNSTQDILLLAKYNLKKENGSITLKQDTSGELNYCNFSSTAYWSSVSGIAYPDSTTKKYPDLNDETKYGSGSPVIAKAKAYGESLGVTGRLMTYEEARALEKDYSDILYGKNIEKGYLNYWLGSADDENGVKYVRGENNLIYGSYSTNSSTLNGYYGVRPVIKVPKSLIQ